MIKAWKIKDYMIQLNDRTWTCTCPSFKYGNNRYTKTGYKSCKHIEYARGLYDGEKLNKLKDKIQLVNL